MTDAMPHLETAQIIAATFAGILRGWATEQQWHYTRVTNRDRQDGEDSGTCASHDWCDANMAMHEAWLLNVGRSSRPDSVADAAMWNVAWEQAKTNYLTAEDGEKPKCCPSCHSIHPHDCED